MSRLPNRQVAELALRAASRCIDGVDPPWDVEVYEGDPDATDGRCKARWKKLTEAELNLAIRMLDYAGYDIVERPKVIKDLCGND